MRKYRKRLKTLLDVRRFLADVANQLNQDEIPESKARGLAYICSILQAVIKDADIEKRLEVLEKLENERNAKDKGSKLKAIPKIG